MIQVKKNKKVIIHAGPGKTGSSAIQAWLIKNKSYLANHSVLYPEYKLSAMEISSGNMRAILSRNEESNGYGGINKSKWFVDKEKTNALLQSFNESNFSVLLLSSEFFFHQMVAIQKLIPEVEFIAYIRNPLELLESNYNQAVKRHSISRRFKAPPKINDYLWPYLDKVFNELDVKKIHLRPYEKSLMVNHNIVSDLLSVLNLAPEVEDKKVNLSYTYSALEFKRLCNQFNLGPLEPKLDAVLQGCNVGERNYSLMKESSFKKLNNESCVLMQEFIDKYEQQYLNKLLTIFKAATQQPYIEQCIDRDSLVLIADYIKTKDMSLYKSLSQLIATHTNLFIDNPAIYDVFGVKARVLSKEKLINDVLLAHINQFTVNPSQRGKICYELSCFYLQQSDVENALMFAKSSHYFNPKNQLFIEQLNKVIRLDNEQKGTVSYDSKTSLKTSKFYRFKKLLKR